MSANLTLGQVIPLSYNLFEADGTKYVLADVTKQDNTLVAGSPVQLFHVGGGKYRSNALLMPNTPNVFVTYSVWDDDQFTVESDIYSRGDDRFTLTENGGGSGGGAQSSCDALLMTIIDDDIVEAKVFDDDNVTMEVIDDDVIL